MSEKNNNKPALTADFLKSVAKMPGIYLMKDKSGKVLYVGKAKNIHKRLSSYQKHLGSRSSKTGVMLSQAAIIETIITATEKEAFILEASLIKKHRPKYNIILRDDKNYPLIKITINEEWPRLMMTRKIIKDGARYFGPYSSSSLMWDTIRLLNKLFPLRRCKGKDVKMRERPCLDFQMQQCMAPCVNAVSKDEYMLVVGKVIMALEGKNMELIKEMKAEMLESSDNLQFEKAANLRDKISAIQKTVEKQVVVSTHSKDQDVFGYIPENHDVALAVLHIRKGVITGMQKFYLTSPLGSDAEIIAEVLERFYDDTRPVPNEIFLPFAPENLDFFQDWLAIKRGSSVLVRIPQRGSALKLLQMAANNAKQVFKERNRSAEQWQILADSIRKHLGLAKKPERITCVDISNLAGEQSVGAVVSFFKGEKESAAYRHYKIKTVSGPDDYGSMQETLLRHLKRAEADDLLPDLLMVDGGKGQLNIAIAVLKELRINKHIDLVGIAKEKNEEGEKLYIPGRKNPITMSSRSAMLLFLMKVRDETHRYGITFHRKWRGRENLLSELDEIAGVGPARKRALLAELGSLKRIKAASIDQLKEVKGINLELAQLIVDYFKNNHHRTGN